VTLSGLLENLKLVKEAHPEAENAEVWTEAHYEGRDHETRTIHTHAKFFRFDKRHHPARIILE